MSLDNSSAIVTGGASGMGAATARRLAAEGAHVVVPDRDSGTGEAVARELGGSFVLADVTSEDEVRTAVELAVANGPLRVCIHCAGVGWAERTVSRSGAPHSLETFRKIVEINLIGTFNVLRLTAAGIARADPGDDGERGVIVNTASVAAYDGQVGQAAYSASKGGVVSMTLPIARELARYGIRVMAIAPGPADTPMLAQLPDTIREALEAQIPFPQRLARPEEFAALVGHIVENPYLNGEVIRLDGGLRMPPR